MVPGIFFLPFLRFAFLVFLKWRCRTLIQPKLSTPELHHGTYFKKRGGLTSCSNSRSLFPLTKREILAWISADGSHDTHATFILSSSTLNLRHFSIVMGSKCKGIMGTVVLCTSCPLLNECVISRFPLRKHAYSFFSSYPYYTLVHDHIRISYFILYPGAPFYSEAAQEHAFICYSSSVFIRLSVRNVYQSCRGTSPYFLSSFEVIFNHMAHVWNAFRHVDCVFDHTLALYTIILWPSL